MALVHVVAFEPLVAHCRKYANATDAEDRFLGKTVKLVSAVKVMRKLSIPLRVFGDIGIQKVNRDMLTADSGNFVFPTAQTYTPILDSHRYPFGHFGQIILDVPLPGQLRLYAFAIEFLQEVAFSVEQGHGDQRNPVVGRGADGVSCEDAQTTAIGRDLRFESNLHRKVSDPSNRQVVFLLSAQFGCPERIPHNLSLYREIGRLTAGIRLCCGRRNLPPRERTFTPKGGFQMDFNQWPVLLGDLFAKLSQAVSAYFPNLLGAAVVAGLRVGSSPSLLRFIASRFLGRLHTLIPGRALGREIKSSGFDRLATDLVSTVVFWAVFLFFVAAATEALGLSAVTNGLGRLAGYLPGRVGFGLDPSCRSGTWESGAVRGD